MNTSEHSVIRNVDEIEVTILGCVNCRRRRVHTQNVVHVQDGQEQVVENEHEYEEPDWDDEEFEVQQPAEPLEIQLAKHLLKWNVILLLVWYILDLVVRLLNEGQRQITDLSKPALALAGITQ